VSGVLGDSPSLAVSLGEKPTDSVQLRKPVRLEGLAVDFHHLELKDWGTGDERSEVKRMRNKRTYGSRSQAPERHKLSVAVKETRLIGGREQWACTTSDQFRKQVTLVM
jgi:hypothetical protein